MIRLSPTDPLAGFTDRYRFTAYQARELPAGHGNTRRQAIANARMRGQSVAFIVLRTRAYPWRTMRTYDPPKG